MHTVELSFVHSHPARPGLSALQPDADSAMPVRRIRFPRWPLAVLFVLLLDSCAWVEWSAMAEADEALAECRRRHGASSASCARAEAEATERQRDYDDAVEGSACYDRIRPDAEPRATTPDESYE